MHSAASRRKPFLFFKPPLGGRGGGVVPPLRDTYFPKGLARLLACQLAAFSPLPSPPPPTFGPGA